MHGRLSWRMAGVAVLVAAASAGCAGGSGSTSASPATPGGSGSATGTSPSGAASAPASSQASATSQAPGPSQPATARASRSRTTAQEATGAVRGYYGAVAAHTASAAQQFLAPEYLASFGGGSAFAGWVGNYRSLTRLTLRAARTPSSDVPPQHPGYRDLTFIPVSYVAQLRSPSGNETSGAQDRFVLVGRSAESGGWLIVDIATSP